MILLLQALTLMWETGQVNDKEQRYSIISTNSPFK